MAFWDAGKCPDYWAFSLEDGVNAPWQVVFAGAKKYATAREGGCELLLGNSGGTARCRRSGFRHKKTSASGRWFKG